MTDFSSNIANFFRSEAPTFSEFDKILKESSIQEDWIDAVNLYRKGVFALQKNDFSGLEIIQQANESLKKVLDTSKESVSLNMKALNESVETFKQNSPDDLQLIKFNFGMLYEACKQNGMKSILNEENFYKEDDGDGSVDAQSLDEEEKIEDADAEKLEKAEESTITEETPTADTVVPPTTDTATTSTPAPAATVEPTPVLPQNTETPAPTPVVKESGYKRGFEEGRVYVQGATQNEAKFGTQFKESLKQKIETELYEKPYSYVENYKKGFAAGCATEEEVLKELHPEAWKKFEEEKQK